MTKKLQRKLLKNALQHLNDYYGDEGCNDLSPGHALLRGVTKQEFEQIVSKWKKLFPKQFKDFDGNLRFDFLLVDTLIKSLP